MSGSHITKIGRKQALLLPDMIENYIDEDNPTRLFDSFVDSLDLKDMGFRYAVLKEGPGAPSYDPSDLLKLYLWGYYNGIRSSRKLENECYRNLEVMWLIRKLKPDFKTISDFRKDSVDIVKGLFRRFNLFLKEHDLFKSHDIAIDGTKMKAVNAKERSFTKEQLEKQQDNVDEKIEKFLKEMDENDAIEQDIDRSKIREAIEKMNERKKKLDGVGREMAELGVNELSLTDPEARQMKTRHGVDVCYNAHIAVESEHHLISDYTVDNDTNDYASLLPLARSSKELMGKIDVSADRGHFSLTNLLNLYKEETDAYIPTYERGSPFRKKGVGGDEYASSKFIYDKERDVYICPQGNEMHYRSNVPNGLKNKVFYRVYSTDACKSCPVVKKCTTSKRGRWMQRWEYADIEDEHWRRMKSRGRDKMKLRKRTVEHPFGTIKRAMNQGYLLLKGLRKVRGEFGFSAIAYNMKRAISIKGVRALIHAV